MHQKLILICNVGQQPETKEVNGSQVTSFPVATSEKYTNKAGEKVEETEWHNVVMWRKLAEIGSKWVNKGDKLYIEGKLKTRSWEKDGQKYYRTDVIADTMKMLGGKSEPKSQQEDNINPEGSDLPF